MRNYFLAFVTVCLSIFISCGGDSEEPKIDCSKTDLALANDGTTAAGCTTDGSLTVSATGGSSPITFSVDGLTFQSSGTFSLSAGNYTVTAKDANDCLKTLAVTVPSAQGSISINTTTTDTGCGSSSGSIVVTASGGDGSYMYSLNSGTAQSTNTFSNLASGSYTITVTDGQGCDAQVSKSVVANTSLTNDIMPIINANCGVNGCHVSGTGRVVFLNNKNNVIANAATIRDYTQSGFMPQGGSLSQTNKDLIACWVDAGKKDN